MVVLIYGEMELKIGPNSKFLSPKNQKRLLNGLFVLETGVPVDVDDKTRKSYYIGVLYELFKANYEEFSNGEIYAMMSMAYPLFLKERQIQNHLMSYNKLKIHKDVFSRNW